MNAPVPVMAGFAGFLLARIAEDEARANPLTVVISGGWPADEVPNCIGRNHRAPSRTEPPTSTALAAECDAKRRIVGLHEPWAYACAGCDSLEICPTLQALALPYADHPDYRQEWKP